MTAYVKVAGTWRTLNPRIKTGGAWRGLNGGWVKVAGTWRKFYPAPGVLDVQHMTSGVIGTAPNRSTGYWNGGTPFGALADGISNIWGVAINGIYWSEQSVQMSLNVSTAQANGGFTYMTINGVSYARTSATFLVSGGQTYWAWNGIGADPLTGNPTVTFT